METLKDFATSLADETDLVAALRNGVIGEGVQFDGPLGRKPLIYADYVASGRALRQVEDFVAQNVLPYYANSHTEASFCGQTMTRMRAEARTVVKRVTRANDDYAVVFSGAGATSCLNRLVNLLDIQVRVARGDAVTVLIGPYEHHTNILPWRESGAQVIEVDEAEDGGVCLSDLQKRLAGLKGHDLIVGSFSAASNVTGQLSDVNGVTRALRAAGAVSIWDYAGAGPYCDIDMCVGSDAQKDAVFLSPHKFIGGPGASGVMVLDKRVFARPVPTQPGGGTVTFVSPWGHEYSADLSAREEGGTPNVIGDIRTALALLVKEAIGQEFIDRRNAELRALALEALAPVSDILLLGIPNAAALPIFSFQVHIDGKRVHHQLFTRMLSDVYGIQARGGCACAGPYGHRLLKIDETASRALKSQIQAGAEIEKPGWVRFNLSYLLTDDKAAFILRSIVALTREFPEWVGRYVADERTARFSCEGVRGLYSAEQAI